MKNVKNNAPDGATHWCPKTGAYWLIDIGGMSYKWADGMWRSNGAHYPKGMHAIYGEMPKRVLLGLVAAWLLVLWWLL